MCGIAGILKLDSSNIELSAIKNFTEPIAHRGPDGEGYWIHTDKHVAFGHRRLSILDVSDLAKQPMAFAEGRYQITYNGEVFNFLELKSELEKKGYTFKSESDTEVILAAYDYWGPDCLHRFNGMWAFAIWDDAKNELFLARDRFGIKPLYYVYKAHKLFAFGSETNQFKCLEGFEREFEENHLLYCLQHTQNAFEGLGLTLFKGIHQLKPGHFALLKDGDFKLKRWWNTTENIPEIPNSFEDQVDKFREILIDSCKIRLRSDVSLATALSGGLDSSSIFCVLNRIIKQHNGALERLPKDWQKAYIGSFPGTSQDETKYAKSVLKFLNAEGKLVLPEPENLIDEVVETTRKFDALYITPISVISNVYRVMANDGYKVSLDGHGVDEMMYGYKHSLKSVFDWATDNNQGEYAREVNDIFLNMSPVGEAKPFTIDKRVERKPAINLLIDKVVRKLKQFSNPSQRKWFHNQPNLAYAKNYTSDAAGLIKPEAHLYHEFHVNILPTLLRNFDKASMLNGIEIRMPFMDYRLVSYVFGLPLESKIGGNYTKRILRNAMDGIVPEDVRKRTLKIGIAAPTVEWFSGVMKEYILEEVSSTDFLQSPYWMGNNIRAFVQKKCKEKSWDGYSTNRFWLVLNAHILLNRNQ